MVAGSIYSASYTDPSRRLRTGAELVSWLLHVSSRPAARHRRASETSACSSRHARLPRTDRGADRGDHRGPREEMAMRVLVIEDDDAVRSALRRALLLGGYES